MTQSADAQDVTIPAPASVIYEQIAGEHPVAGIADVIGQTVCHDHIGPPLEVCQVADDV